MNYEILRRTAGYRLAILAILALLLAAALLAGLRFGSLRLDAAEILHTLLSEREGVKFQILWNIRLPRVLLGALVGGSLAVSGAVLQGIMRNRSPRPASSASPPAAGWAACWCSSRCRSSVTCWFRRPLPER